MEVKNKGGRPKSSNPRNESIGIRVTSAEVEHLVTEASKEGKVLSEYIRSKVFKER